MPYTGQAARECREQAFALKIPASFDRNSRDAATQRATARVFFHVNAIFLFRPTEATLFPQSSALGNLPRRNWATRPALSKALDAHAVMPLACTHTEHLSCCNQPWRSSLRSPESFHVIGIF